MNSTVVKQISECFIKPKTFADESIRPYYLTPCDLSMLSFHYIQKGLLFTIPSHLHHQEYSIHNLLESLKESLSITLVQFYTLAGQLSTQTEEDKQQCLVFVDCNKGPGAKFIHATLDLTVSDIISSRYVPQVVHALFDHDRAVNCDGHTLPLLSVQVTELLDGDIMGLKSKANHDSKIDKISSFQALTAFVWKSIVKATSRPGNEVTKCRLAINNRPRLDPPFHNNYFGNCVNVLTTSTTVSELLNHDLGWAASQLHQLVVNYNDKTIRDEVDQWLLSPVFFRLDMLDSPGITMSSSPRFDMYGNEFGLGKPVAIRSGSANKFAGSVTAYPGREGGGNVELEICLPPESMCALELDEEFMAAASLSHTYI
ncbi:hypothetical protein KSS87_018115 [Heliosperma pusillum]|nr:hypothetical protein KSS87_018115 [Heliosperma pusillum]